MTAPREPVIPQSFEIEPLPLDFGDDDRPCVVTRGAKYVNAGGQTFEVTAIARQQHAEELSAYTRRLKIWLEAVQPPAEDEVLAGEAKAARFEALEVDASRLDTFLRDMERAQPDDVCLAVEVALRHAPGFEHGPVTIFGRIDPSIAVGRCHGYSGPNYVSLVRLDGEVSLRGVANGPRYLGPNVEAVYANNWCWVRGEQAPAAYDIGARWSFVDAWWS